MRSVGPVRTTRVACAVTKDSPGSGETKQSVGAAQLASLPRDRGDIEGDREDRGGAAQLLGLRRMLMVLA